MKEGKSQISEMLIIRISPVMQIKNLKMQKKTKKCSKKTRKEHKVEQHLQLNLSRKQAILEKLLWKERMGKSNSNHINHLMIG